MPGRGDIRAGRAYVELALRDRAFRKGLAGAIRVVKSAAVGAIAFGTAASAAGGLALKAFMDTGDALDKMRQRTGLSVEALSKLSHAADQSGTSLDVVEAAIRKMQKGLGATGGPSKELTESLKGLGLTVAALEAMKPEDQFNAIADAIAKIPDPTKRAAKAQEIFGKSGTQLLPMIEDFAALRKEAEEMGFVMTGEAAASAVKLGDQLSNLWKTVKFGAITVGEILAPALSAAAAAVQQWGTATLKWLGSIRDAMVAGNFGLAASIMFATIKIAALEGVASLSNAVGGAIGDFIGTVGTELLSGDLSGAWSTTLAGLGEQWAVFAEGLTAVFTTAMRGITDLWETTTKAIAGWIIENASKGGVLGKFLLGSGVDMQSEVERSKKIDEMRRRAGLKPTGGDVVGDAKAAASGILTGQADAFRGKLDAIDAAAQARTAAAASKFRDRTRGGASGANDALDAAKAELARLRAQAAAEADAARAKGQDAAKGGQVPALADPAKAIFGTFSAAALAVAGGPEQQAQRTREETLAVNRKIYEEQKTTRRELSRFGKVK